MAMLNDYCVHHDIDILLLQEVTHHNFDQIKHRNCYFNIGTEVRGTAITTKDYIELKEIQRLPSGRGIAGWWNDLYIVNLYAPSGTGKKKERDEFYSLELPHLLQNASQDYIIAGDFNCVIRHEDSTGTPTTSKPLETFITSCKLTDAWDSSRNNVGYTHYTTHGATRIDRLYLSQAMLTRKISTTTLAAAFTDHHAVKLTLQGQRVMQQWGNGYWKLNITLLTTADVQNRFKQQWEEWGKKKKWYRDVGHWWGTCVKQGIKRFFKTEGYEQKRDHTQQSNFYYTCIYDLIQSSLAPTDRHIRLKYYKAKITKLYSDKLRELQAELRGNNWVPDEQMSIYHIISRQQRRQKKLITRITGIDGVSHTTPQEIRKVFYQ
jgi:exonuclease III